MQYENRLFQDNNCTNPRAQQTLANEEKIYETEEKQDKKESHTKHKKGLGMRKGKNIKKRK
jgi:hypothetical protein